MIQTSVVQTPKQVQFSFRQQTRIECLRRTGLWAGSQEQSSEPRPWRAVGTSSSRGAASGLPGFDLLSALAQSQIVQVVSPTDFQTRHPTLPLCACGHPGGGEGIFPHLVREPGTPGGARLHTGHVASWVSCHTGGLGELSARTDLREV